MTLLRHAILFARLFRERRDNPLVSSYHFGQRIGKRGIGYFVLRGALALGPLLAVGMCMNFSFSANVSTALAWYLKIGLLYLWFLPSLIFQFFGVKKLDRQNVEDLSLTRLSGSEIVFGLFFWPSMTVLFAAFPYFCGATLLLMFSDRNIEFSIHFPVMLVTGAFVLVSSLVSTLTSFAADLRSRILVTLAHGGLMLATLFVLFTMVDAIIRANESVRYISPMNYLFPAALVPVMLAKIESLLTGSSWRLLHPPFVMPKFPLVPFIQRARMWWAGFFAAALAMLACVSISLLLQGTSYSDLWRRSSVSRFPPTSMVAAVIGWGMIPILAVVSCTVQVSLLRRYMQKVRAEDPQISLRLPRLHFASGPFLVYAIAFVTFSLLLAGGWFPIGMTVDLSIFIVLIVVLWFFMIVTAFVSSLLVSTSRPRYVAYELVYASVLGYFALFYCSVAYSEQTYNYPVLSYAPPSPVYWAEASWQGLLLLFAYVVALACILNGWLKVLVTRLTMRISKQLEESPSKLLRVTPS